MKSKSLCRFLSLVTFAVAAGAGVSCKSTTEGTTSDQYVDYTDDPFDAQGNYKTEWVAAHEGVSQPYVQNDDKPSASSSTSSARKPSSTGSSSRTKTRPKIAAKPKPKPKPKPVVVTIKKGDTLYGLALKYKTSVSAIKSYNGMKSDFLRDGRAIKIPPKR